MDHRNWEDPEIIEWEDDPGFRSENDRQVFFGFGFGCFPRQFCWPRQSCFPRQFCWPRQSCFPRHSCWPRQSCWPREGCWPR